MAARNGIQQAMANLLQAQAQLTQAQAELVQNQAKFVSELREMNERFARTEAESNARFARIERLLAEIKAILARHEQILQALPDAIRQKIGFESRRY